MSGVVGIVFVLAVVGGIAYATYRYAQAQIERARAVAARHGLQIDTSTKKPPPLPFDLFDRGGSKKLRFQMWRVGEQDSVFQYQYTVGSGDDSRTYKMTGALVEVPFEAPHLTISTENWWTKMKRAVGLRDVELESPQFNDRYHVRCADERFAVTLLDPSMIAWMLSPSSGQGSVSFEFGGPWMLAYTQQLDIEELPGLLAWAQSARTQLPAVLGEWYARPS